MRGGTGMRIAIMGSGGIGGYFGARLAKGGADVIFIARGRHLEAMRRDGLLIESAQGNIHVPDVQATDDPASVGMADLVMVGVKLWDTEEAAEAVLPLARAGAAVVSFQNGVQKDDILRAVVGEAALMGGVSYIAASIARPGVIAHVGHMQRLVFGEFDGSRSARAEAFLTACQRGGIDAELHPDIRRATWEKFVFLVGLSATTSGVRRPVGVVRANETSRALLLDVMREVVAVGRARGVDLAPDFPENRLAFIDTLPAAMTSSMHGDLERGSRLEVDWLSGGVVRMGADLGVPTPLNRAIVALLAPHAAGAAA